MTVVRQGCALSPILFALLVDWVMKRTTKNRNTYKTREEAAKVELLMDPDKSKITKIGKWNDTGGVIIEGKEIETVDAVCYFGSTLTDDSSRDQEIRARIGKANAAFGKPEKIWKSNGCGIKAKIILYETVVGLLSTLLYGSETWPLANDGGKWKEAGYSTQQLSQKNITHLLEGQDYKQGDVEKDGTGKYEKHHKKKKTTLDGWRLARMDGQRRAVQAMDWSLEGKRKRGMTAKELARNYSLYAKTSDAWI